MNDQELMDFNKEVNDRFGFQTPGEGKNLESKTSMDGDDKININANALSETKKIKTKKPLRLTWDEALPPHIDNSSQHG